MVRLRGARRSRRRDGSARRYARSRPGRCASHGPSRNATGATGPCPRPRRPPHHPPRRCPDRRPGARPSGPAACRAAVCGPRRRAEPYAGGALVAVVPQGAHFTAGQQPAVRAHHPPPGHGGAVERHHPPHLPRAPFLQPLRNIAVRHHPARRNQLGNGQDPFRVLREIRALRASRTCWTSRTSRTCQAFRIFRPFRSFRAFRFCGEFTRRLISGPTHSVHPAARHRQWDRTHGPAPPGGRWHGESAPVRGGRSASRTPEMHPDAPLHRSAVPPSSGR